MAALAPTVGLGAPALGGSIEIPVKDSDEVRPAAWNGNR